MIVTIRGTSGSGKSTIVQTVMKDYSCAPFYLSESTRKTPFGYDCNHIGEMRRPLWIVGNYETQCGGADLIRDQDSVIASISQQAAAGYHVLYEGVIAQSWSRERLRKLIDDSGTELLIVVLTTPLDECIEAVKQRREQRVREGKTLKFPEFKTDNLVSKYKSVLSSTKRLLSEPIKGVSVVQGDRESCLAAVREAIK